MLDGIDWDSVEAAAREQLGEEAPPEYVDSPGPGSSSPPEPSHSLEDNSVSGASSLNPSGPGAPASNLP